MKKIKRSIALILMLSLTSLFFRCSTDNTQLNIDEDDPDVVNPCDGLTLPEFVEVL